MSEDENVVNDEVEVKAQELSALKNKADTLGVKYHPNIGIDKLQDKINTHLEELNKAETVDSKVNDSTSDKQVTSPVESKQQRNMRKRKEATRLLRIRLTCMNPVRAKLAGDFYSVSNSVIGTVRKFIPFNGEPYHVPVVLYNLLKSRVFQQFRKVKLPNGKTKMEGSLVKEFAIELLDPLTNEELSELKTQQALNRSID